MSEHFSYLESVSRMAEANWGNSFSSTEEADKSLVSDPQKLAAFAALEMLHRVTKVCKGIAGSREYGPDEYSVSLRTRSGDAQKFPAIAIGGSLWCGELEDGISERVACGRDQDGYLLTVGVVESNQYAPRVCYADSDDHATLCEAVRAAAKRDIEYHGKCLRYAEEAMRAAEAGDDLSRYLRGIDEESDEE